MSDKPPKESHYYVENDDGSKRSVGSDVPQPPAEGGGEPTWPERPPVKLDDATVRELDDLASSDSTPNPAERLARLLAVAKAIAKQQPPCDEYSTHDPWPPEHVLAQKLAALLKTGSGIASKMAGMKWLCEFLATLSVKASDQEFWLYGTDFEQIDRARSEVAKAQSAQPDPFSLSKLSSFKAIAYLANELDNDPDQQAAAGRLRDGLRAWFGGDDPSSLVEGSDYYTDKGKRSKDEAPTEGGTEPNSSAPESPLEDLLTLDQIAATVSKSKRTLEHYLKEGKLPKPDIRGGGGKPHRWKWSTVLPSLRKHFRPDLPDRFPGSRIV